MLAAAKGVLIYARSTTKNTRKEQRRIRCLKNGGTWAKRKVIPNANITVTLKLH
jgi:hypothetical protein